MFDKAALMWIYAEHPVHAGSGIGIGVIDLPIQRENVTKWPIIQPSGLKGALREYFDDDDRKSKLKTIDTDYENKIKEAFGPDTSADHAGAIALTEAKLLLFPVCSLKGTFAYVTCPLAMKRLRRDLKAMKEQVKIDFLSASTDPNISALPDINTTPDENTIWVAAVPQQPANLPLQPDSILIIDNKVILNELSFTVQANKIVNDLAAWLGCRTPGLSWLENKNNISKRLIIVHDDTFRFFVEMYTEVITRNKIDDKTGVVETGALWVEEYLPRESVLYSTIFAVKPFKKTPILADSSKVLDFITGAYCPKYLWVGGNTTTGKGLVKLQFTK
jgi:CRISPR-associated protein Cmr4